MVNHHLAKVYRQNCWRTTDVGSAYRYPRFWTVTRSAWAICHLLNQIPQKRFIVGSDEFTTTSNVMPMMHVGLDNFDW
ncbi:hypothetical protein ACVXHA_03785 [Escherichia coli]